MATREEQFGITQEVLNNLFFYREGKLIRKVNAGGAAKAGDEAGCLRTDGYRHVRIKSRRYKTHRLIWIMHHGTYPERVDHIDGDNRNNSIENLQVVTHSQNLRKQRTYKNNKSGKPGVHWHSRDKKWSVKITVEKKVIHLGYFVNLEDAVKTREDAELKYFGNYLPVNRIG